MTYGKFRKFIGPPIIAASALFFLNAVQPLWADDAVKSPLDSLVVQIKKHIMSCDQVISRQPDFVKRCADEKAKLLAEQKQLGVSDQTIDNELNSGPQTRGGWRWP
jgi:hypothetical protein